MIVLTLSVFLWRAKCVITKTYRLTHFTDNSHRNEKLFLTGRIVSLFIGTYLCIAMRFVLLAISFLQYDVLMMMYRQRCIKQQRSETSNTCLCITIRFVVTGCQLFAIYLICPDSCILHIGALE